jgi:hypothetical protein
MVESRTSFEFVTAAEAEPPQTALEPKTSGRIRPIP